MKNHLGSQDYETVWVQGSLYFLNLITAKFLFALASKFPLETCQFWHFVTAETKTFHPPSRLAADPSAHITFDHRNVTHEEWGIKKQDSSYLQVFVFIFFKTHLLSQNIKSHILRELFWLIVSSIHPYDSKRILNSYKVPGSAKRRITTFFPWVFAFL